MLFSDMENSSQYVQSLALCTLANVCSTEMARDLAPDVEKLMKTANSYIKKKVRSLCIDCLLLTKNLEEKNLLKVLRISLL